MEWTIRIQDVTCSFSIMGAHVRGIDPGWKYRIHHHPTFELLHCLEGTSSMRVNGRKILLNSGDFILLRPNEIHDLENDSPETCKYFTFHFDMDDPEIRKLLCSGNGLIPSGGENATELRDHVHQFIKLINEAGSREPVSSNPAMPTMKLSSVEILKIQSLLPEILLDLISVFDSMEGSGDGQSNRAVRSREHVELACKIANLLEQNTESSVRIQDIAEKLCISLSLCNKVFNDVYGLSPRNYLTRVKLNQAKRYLIDSELAVEEIAERLGFASISHFSRQFKRWTGVSPSAYRNRQFVGS